MNFQQFCIENQAKAFEAAEIAEQTAEQMGYQVSVNRNDWRITFIDEESEENQEEIVNAIKQAIEEKM